MKWIMAVTLVFSSATFAQTVHTLTLEDALRIGQENSKLLKVSAFKQDAASAKSSEAYSSLLPTVKFEGSYRRLSDVDPFQIQLPVFPTPFIVSPTVLNNYTLKASVQQPVFTGFRLHSNARASEHLAQASEADYRNDKADLVLHITASYWMLYQTVQVKKYIDENVQRLQTDVKDVESLIKAGMATRNDLLKVQVQLSNARLSQIDAANDIRVAMMNLNNAIGQPIDAELELTSVPGQRLAPDDSTRPGPWSLQSAIVAQALASRPDLAAMQSRIEASKAFVTSAQANWWPQIFLTGNYYYSRPNTRILPTRDEFKGTWDVGVQMLFDVWNWGTTMFQSEQAKATQRQNELLYEQMKDNVTLDVQRQYLSLKRANEKTGVARLAVEQAEENARTTSDKFKNGLATSSDLVDADVTLLQARTNLTGAHVECELAQARLARAVGNPTDK